MRHVFIVPALALALCAQARAQEPAVVELRLFGARTDRAGLGNFVEVAGRELHRCPPAPADEPERPRPCAHPGLVVKVGGVEVPILAATPESIMVVLVESVPTGKRRLEVELRGRRLGALDLQVLPEPIVQPEPGGGEAPPQARFEVTRFDLLQDGAGVRFVVEGRALRVPDGAVVSVALCFERRAIEHQQAAVDDQAFRATFGPFSRALPLGEWQALSLFEIKKQPRVVLRRWDPADTQKDALDHIERAMPLTVGTAEEIAAQRQALRAHYRGVAQATERLLDDALAAYASGCRVLFRDAARNTYGVAEHAAHVQRVLAARTPEELARVQADLRFATATGHFKADAYQGWAEGTFLPAWLGSWRGDATYREATQVPIDPRSARLAEDLHTLVLGTLQRDAQALFTASRLEAPPSLVNPPDGVVLPSLEGTGHGRRAFERRRDELLARLPGS